MIYQIKSLQRLPIYDNIYLLRYIYDIYDIYMRYLNRHEKNFDKIQYPLIIKTKESRDRRESPRSEEGH